MEPWIRSIRPDNFTEEVVLETKPLLIICLAQDDGFAGQLTILQDIARRFAKEIKVGLLAQDSMEICKRKLQIIGTPTFLLMKNGGEVGRILGRADQETLTHFIVRHLPADSTGSKKDQAD